jgi:hypothetical protein
MPLGWSSDGAWVYLAASKETKGAGTMFSRPTIWKAPARGGPAVEVAKLPFKEINAVGDAARDGRRFVFSVVEARSDAWVIENFDPELQRK